MTDPAYSGRWKQIRLMILERDGHLCQIKGPGCTRHATHVDHIVPADLGGTADERNLRAACSSCNVGRANRERHNKPSRTW